MEWGDSKRTIFWCVVALPFHMDLLRFHAEVRNLLGLFHVKLNLLRLGLKPVRAQSSAVRVDCHNVRKILLPVRIELASMSPSQTRETRVTVTLRDLTTMVTLRSVSTIRIT